MIAVISIDDQRYDVYVKLPKHFPFNRHYQRTCLSSKIQQSSMTSNLKPIKQQKPTTESSNFITVSILSIPSTIETITTHDANHEHNTSSSSILAVV
ncbi:unnamed protein product [Rotaria sp. Silwood1]|nr:unnamed protein product [Rotaria sp. Silwood1]